jgi:two-component system, chemotaxis family, protein-glutamate methylesterase/glutaminase
VTARSGPVRVLVLDASSASGARYGQLLRAHPQLGVAGHASSGEHAVEIAAASRPDVMLACAGPDTARMVGWIRHVMQTQPLPVVALASGWRGPDGREAFDFMAAGALTVLRPPEDARDAAELACTLRLMAEVKVVRRWKALTPAAAAPPAAAEPVLAPRAPVELVVVGASTGGPVVLQQLLSGLTRGFPLPIVIVQHMATGFVHGLAEWLSASGPIPTRVAQAGMALEPGRAYLAPDGANLRIAANRTLALDQAAPINGHRPSVAALFSSAAQHCGRRCVAVLLTGMGKDGAAELKALHDLGAVTIAQDQASSVVHGMPAEAIRLGGASHVMSPAEMAAALPVLVARKGTRT